MLREAATGSQLAAPPPQIGKAQNSIDQIIVGRQLKSIHTSIGEGAAELTLAALRQRREARSKSAVVGIDQQLLPGLGVAHRNQSKIGQLHF